ncbi:hypothetical protein [Pseudoclavibacter sp. AY1H1]|uniref:hypothetical protein n=1 Tax=Pseudoclavibacter sp. AY1H1 TaxID=2080584 RepID=UPI000CE8BB35|nr:hypothetical protein [Pseudoclavibacter sp. AY1H1]PPF38325.1 hypothetical protein C5E05_04755 [Pseudoclavibacter sp. AY1H1]
MIAEASGVTIDGQGFITIAVGLLGFLGVLVTFLGTRGKTTADAKAALDKRIDDRLAAQMTLDEEKISKLTARVEELETHSGHQDRKITRLEDRDKRKSQIFQRIFTTLAAMLPASPELELTTSEIDLVGDTIPPSWVRHLKE